MNLADIALLSISLLLVIYLLVALFMPEKF
ncbi:MAG: K(+)-transporting ATPase subunit F [Acidimicrobiales bacterium]|nr:K(+)-transporting ATPase subunit F [Acidimicrobiales bacterium]